jgi:hypothetical protein
MPTIPELLDESEKNIKGLVNEIQTFKTSRILNEKATSSLESVAAALNKTVDAIKPLKTSSLRWFIIIFSSITIINTFLLIAILVIITVK